MEKLNKKGLMALVQLDVDVYTDISMCNCNLILF